MGELAVLKALEGITTKGTDTLVEFKKLKTQIKAQDEAGKIKEAYLKIAQEQLNQTVIKRTLDAYNKRLKDRNQFAVYENGKIVIKELPEEAGVVEKLGGKIPAGYKIGYDEQGKQIIEKIEKPEALGETSLREASKRAEVFAKQRVTDLELQNKISAGLTEASTEKEILKAIKKKKYIPFGGRKREDLFKRFYKEERNRLLREWSQEAPKAKKARAFLIENGYEGSPEEVEVFLNQNPDFGYERHIFKKSSDSK